MNQTKHSGPIEFERTKLGYFTDGSDYTFNCHLRWSDGDRQEGVADAADIVAALQANPEVRAEVLDALGHREETKHSGPIEFDFGDSWRLRLWLKGKADGDRGFEPFGMACPEHLIAALVANPEVRTEVLDALHDNLTENLRAAEARELAEAEAYQAARVESLRLSEQLLAAEARVRELEAERSHLVEAAELLRENPNEERWRWLRIQWKDRDQKRAAGTAAPAPVAGTAAAQPKCLKCGSLDSLCEKLGCIEVSVTEPAAAQENDAPPGGHSVAVYQSADGDTLSFAGGGFTTVRACRYCGVLITGGPTACVHCVVAEKTPQLTRADVLRILAEVARAAAGEAAADVAFLDEAACRYGTRLGIPSEIPGFDPGDPDHIHFVLMPIGAAARRAAVEWLKSQEAAEKAAKGEG